MLYCKRNNYAEFHMKYVPLYLIVILFFSSVRGQNLDDEIRSLENDYKLFRHDLVLEKGRFLLADPFATKNDSLQIFQLMLSASYSLNDTSTARQIISDILASEPGFALNPRQTAPKIIEFFNHIKNQIKAGTSTEAAPLRVIVRTDTLFIQQSDPWPTISGLLLPGSGHYLKGSKKKGLAFTALSAGLLGGIIYSSFKTEQFRKDYSRAGQGADFQKLYGRYDNYYKSRNILIALYAAWSLYSIYDLQKQSNLKIQLSSQDNKLLLGMQAKF